MLISIKFCSLKQKKNYPYETFEKIYIYIRNQFYSSIYLPKTILLDRVKKK